MIEIALAVAPIFLLILLGHGLRRGQIPSLEFWNLNDRLVYWVLIPALLFSETSRIPLDPALVGPQAVAILGGYAAAVFGGWGMARLVGAPAPAATSIFQGASRHNTFMALAAAETLYGAEGLAIAALTTSILVPTTNLVTVTGLVAALRPPGRGAFTSILRDLARNPLLLGVTLGVASNLAGLGRIPVVHDAAELLGGAALPIVLLCIGANIHLSHLSVGLKASGAASLVKFILFPAATYAVARLVGLGDLATVIAVMFAATPCASSAYPLARQMGGDSVLMAEIIALQTLAAYISLPATLMIVRALTG